MEQGEAKRLSALLVRRLQCLLVLRGLVVTDNATCGRSQHAEMAGDIEPLPHWAGQGVGLVTREESAAVIVDSLVREAEEAIESLT